MSTFDRLISTYASLGVAVVVVLVLVCWAAVSAWRGRRHSGRVYDDGAVVGSDRPSASDTTDGSDDD